MNEAQKFLLNNKCDDLRLKDAQKVENWIYVSDMMERYHQEQVENNDLLHNVREDCQHFWVTINVEGDKKCCYCRAEQRT